jgi:hypothetical protein
MEKSNFAGNLEDYPQVYPQPVDKPVKRAYRRRYDSLDVVILAGMKSLILMYDPVNRCIFAGLFFQYVVLVRVGGVFSSGYRRLDGRWGVGYTGLDHLHILEHL